MMSMIKPSSGRLLFLRPAAASSINLISIRSLSTKSIDQSTREAYLERSKEYAGIAFLNLNRPGAKNALSPTLLDQTREALQEVRFDGTTRVLIVQSTTPSIFCAGADLKQRKTMTPPQVTKFLHTMKLMMSEIAGLPIPTIAALDGAALGGGFELALCCDLRVASVAATKIGLPETRLAIIPGAGGTQRLSRLIGISKAKELIFTARVLSAAEALHFGVINCLADEGQTATEKAILLAREMLPAGPLAIKAAKLAIDRGSQMDLESGLEFEQTCYATILSSSDRLEGLSSFAEKRKPVYKGE